MITAERKKGSKMYDDCSSIERFRFLTEGRAVVGEILDRENPEMVVLGNDCPYVSNQFVHQAKDRGIPTLLIQDGLFMKSKPCCGVEYKQNVCARLKSRVLQFMLRHFLRLPARERNGLNGCNRVAVMGSFAHDLMVKLSVPKERIFITGLQQFDAMSKDGKQFDAHKRREYLLQRGIDPSKPHTVFFSQPHLTLDHWPQSQWDQLLDLVASLTRRHGNEVSVSIKPHPHNDKSEFDGLFRQVQSTGIQLTFLENSDIKDVLGVTDIAIVYFSTVALEALQMDISIVWLNSWNQSDPFGFLEKHAAVEVRSESDWDRVCQVYLREQDHAKAYRRARAEAIECHIYGRSGNASKRIAKLIMQMCA